MNIENSKSNNYITMDDTGRTITTTSLEKISIVKRWTTSSMYSVKNHFIRF